MPEEEERQDIVKFFESAEIGKEYRATTWYRSVKIQDFVERVEEENEIVGVIFSGNNIGFIIEKRA